MVPGPDAVIMLAGFVPMNLVMPMVMIVTMRMAAIVSMPASMPVRVPVRMQCVVVRHAPL